MPSPDRSFRLLYVLPTVLLLLAAVLPLIAGGETLYLRDLHNTHLEMKWAQAEAMREGRLPLIDPYRAGGQAHLGNPNTVPLYPTNLLYLVAPLLWAFNAHLWLHLLLAPAAFYALARAWGLDRRPAWAAAVLYAGSGFFLSNMNFYNLIGGVTLTPALIAAALLLAGRPTAGRYAALVLLWALTLLAGDPMTAALAAALAAAAVLVRHRREARLGPALAAAAAGTLLAAPQLVEFARIAPLSFRGHWGYSAAASMAASWSPLAALGWLIPFPFGRPDLAFWGQELFQGHLPLYFSLYPGVLALALVAASGRPRAAAARWAWGALGIGLFFALGSFNPAVRWLTEALPVNLLRLPSKLWPAVAVGASLLGGIGFGRLLEGGGGWRRRLLPALAAAWLALAAGLWLAAGPAAVRLRGLVPRRFDDAFVTAELARWIALLAAGAAVLALGALLLRLTARRPALAGAALLAVHLAAQLWLLEPLLAADDAAFYRADPALAARIPTGARVAHGAHDGLFGPSAIPLAAFPDARLLWRQRQMHAGLYPPTGMMRRLRYELNLSPEGLDAFLTRVTAQAFAGLSDADRVRVLAASGVDYLLLERDVEPAALELLEPLGSQPTPGGRTRLYRLRNRAPEVRFAGRVEGSDSLNEALERILDPRFDPRTDTVLAGPRPETTGAGGEVEVLASDAESLAVRVSATGSGALVVQRTFLPLYRATVDGRPAPLVAADLHRLAVDLPAGDHEVRIAVDRRPFRRSLWLALAGLLALVGGSLWWRRPRAVSPAGTGPAPVRRGVGRSPASDRSRTGDPARRA